MNSEKAKNEINIINNYQKKSPASIIDSQTNFMYEEIQQDIPNSESNFITAEKEKQINNDKDNKRKIKQVMLLKDNKLVLNKNKERKNIDIYNYLMKSEDLNNIQNIKELNEIYEKNEIINFIFSRLDKNQILKCNIFISSENNVNN